MQINIGFGINDTFCQHCACTMASILANADKSDKYSFFIVYDNLKKESIKKFEKLKNIKPFKIKFIKVDPLEFGNLSDIAPLNISYFYRIKLFGLKEADKILYLDSDVIIRNDIKTLYATDIANSYLGGAKDIMWASLKKKYKLSDNSIYINSGVLLINTKKTRNIDMLSKIKEFLSLFSEYKYSDQDMINYIFQEQIKEFDIKYNFCYPYMNEYDNEYYNIVSQNPSIIHFITANKPWVAGSKCFMKSEYFKYLALTPYYQDFIARYIISEHEIILNKLSDLENKISV
ncbi:MAG: glycosyltransferase family 8 protein [Candidatus Gastranaerophilales bacterium]|nr:glycosyltransferase family 8 protein [Candidatus Gastranaerophilales bacterium]